MNNAMGTDHLHFMPSRTRRKEGEDFTILSCQT